MNHQQGSFLYTNPYAKTQQNQHGQGLINSSMNENRDNGRYPCSDGNNCMNERMDTNSRIPSIDDSIEQLERGGSSINPTEAVICLKNLLQCSCSLGSQWTIGQVTRYSEWTASVLHTHWMKWKVEESNDTKQQQSNRNNHHRQKTKRHHAPFTSENHLVGTYASFTLFRLMDAFWCDTLIYSSAMTCIGNNLKTLSSNGLKKSYANDTGSLLDSLLNTICIFGDDDDFEEFSKSHRLLHTSILVLATILKALHRLDKMTSSLMTASNTPAPMWTASSSSNSKFWLQLHSLEAGESPSKLTKILTPIVLTGLTMSHNQWQTYHQDSDFVSTSFQQCEYKNACAKILLHILDNQCYLPHNVIVKPCMYHQDWITLQRQLIQESLRLNDTTMPASSFTRWSLTCLQLLTVFNSIGIDPYFVSSFRSNENSIEKDSSLVSISASDFVLSDEYKRIMQSSDIIDHVIRATFWMPGINLADDSPRPKPRWTQQSDSIVTNTAFATLQTLYRTSPVMIGNQIAHHPMTKHFLTVQWDLFLQDVSKVGTISANNSNDHVNRVCQVIFLQRNCRSLARETLQKVLYRKHDQNRRQVNTSKRVDEIEANEIVEACQTFIFHLLERSRLRSSKTDSSLAITVLLKELLSDGLFTVRDDEISRLLWRVINPKFLEKVVETIVGTFQSLTAVSYYYQPMLVSQLDLMYILLKKIDIENGSDVQLYRNYSACLITNQSLIDFLTLVVKPKTNTRGDGTTKKNANDNIGNGSILSLLEESYRSVDSEDSTPTVANTSVVADSHFEQEKDSLAAIKFEIGIGPTVRLAAATILAILGTSDTLKLSGTDICHTERIRDQVLEAVNDYVFECQFTFLSNGVVSNESFDFVRRRVRLFSILGTMENEEYISSMLYSSEVREMRTKNDQRLLLIEYQNEIQEFYFKQKQMKEEKDALVEQLNVNLRNFHREKSEIHRTVSNAAKQLVEVHASERTKVERRLQESLKIKAESDRLLADADRTVKECRDAEANMKRSLDQTITKLEQVSASEKQLVLSNEQKQQYIERVKQELTSVKKSASEIEHKERHMQNQISKQIDIIASMEESENKAKHNLERLFADMCCLAHLYEEKEREVSKYQECGEVEVEKLKRRLEQERKRNLELDELQKRMQYENDMLSKKYAKVREKLEEERDDRRKENERRKRSAGPVSYINQLHNQSTTNIESQRLLIKSSSRSSTNDSNSYRLDKENSTNDSNRSAGVGVTSVTNKRTLETHSRRSNSRSNY